MADFVEKRGANLPADLLLGLANGLDTPLVQINVIGWGREEHALLRARDAMEHAQEQAAPIRLARGNILDDNRDVGESLPEHAGQAHQLLFHQFFETLAFHAFRDCNSRRYILASLFSFLLPVPRDLFLILARHSSLGFRLPVIRDERKYGEDQAH